MKKNLNPSFLTPLNDGPHYADKNEPKQPQVCIKNFAITANSSFKVFAQKHQNFRWLGEPQSSIFIINILHMVFL